MRNTGRLCIILCALWLGCGGPVEKANPPEADLAAMPDEVVVAHEFEPMPEEAVEPAPPPEPQPPTKTAKSVAPPEGPPATHPADTVADKPEEAASAPKPATGDLEEAEVEAPDQVPPEPEAPLPPKPAPPYAIAEKKGPDDAPPPAPEEDLEAEKEEMPEEKAPQEPTPALSSGPQTYLWDDFETSNHWAVESADGPARIGLSTGQRSHGEKSLRAEFTATDRKRFELRRETRLDLTQMDSITADVYNEAKGPMDLALALRSGPGLKLYETPLVALKTGWNNDLVFDLRSETFKVDGTGEYDGLFDGRDDVRRVSLLFHEKDNLSGVVYVDNIRFTGKATESWQQFRPRLTRVAPSAETAVLYKFIEIRVEFEASFGSYYDPAEVSVSGVFVGPDGRRLTLRAFFDGFRKEEAGKGTPVWLIRFAPTVVGRWEYQVTVKNKMGEDVSETMRMECAEKGDSPGFVRRSGRDNLYFEFDRGDFFYPIGQDLAWSGDYEYYFKKMHEHGENYARIWMCPWNLMLERAPYLGEFDLDVARKLDEIVALAEKYDLYIQLVFDYHGMLKDDSWGENPYNSANGGPCASPMDFFVNRDAKKFYKRRLDYIAARWGASTRIFAWEFFNEVDLAKYYSEDDVVNWHNEMMSYLPGVDPYRHLMTTSAYGVDLTKKLGGVGNLNIVQKHLYSTSIVKGIREGWQELCGLGKPYFVAEFGAGVDPEADASDTRGATLHAGVWAAFMTPSAGNAMPWWWDTTIDPNDLYEHWTGLSAFAKGEDRRGKGHKLVYASIPLSGGKKLEIQGLLCKTELLGWVYDPAKIQNTASPEYTVIPSGTYFWLVGMADGEYDIEFWDTYTGQVLERVSKRSDLGRLKITFPEAAKDIACKVKFRGSLVEPALRLQLDEKQDNLRGIDARIPR